MEGLYAAMEGLCGSFRPFFHNWSHTHVTLQGFCVALRERTLGGPGRNRFVFKNVRKL